MFIRVISELKRWSRISEKSAYLPADCFFDIKTSGNTLSLWKVEKDDPDFNKYVVIATLGKMSLSKISYVLINEEEFDRQGLLYQQDSPGCPYINESNIQFVSHHFDIINISHEEYIKIANIIMQKVEQEQIEILSISEVKNVTKQLYSTDLIYKEKLQPNMRECISKLF